MSLTRTGAPNARPLSRLTATNTSVAPFCVVPPHATATKEPAAAMVGVALPRPLTPTSIGALAADTETARTTAPSASQTAGDQYFDRMKYTSHRPTHRSAATC